LQPTERQHLAGTRRMSGVIDLSNQASLNASSVHCRQDDGVPFNKHIFADHLFGFKVA